jgi:predicted metalloendopeptidase
MKLVRVLFRTLAAIALAVLVADAFGVRLPALAAAAIPAPLDPSYFDKTCAPCDDFYTYANGGFFKRHPIPAAFPEWGVGNLVAEDNRDELRGILEKAAADKGAPVSSNRQKIGAYYGACMDLPQIEAAGLDPLRAQLRTIDGITDVGSLAAAAATLAPDGIEAGWSFSSESDAKDSSKTIAGLNPAGLGMPDRDYYLLDDPRTKDIRAKYLAYVTSLLTMSGVDATTAAQNAKDILALETVLAKATPPRAELRDPYKTYHPMSLDALQKLSPAVDWRAYASAVGSPALSSIDVSLPDYMKALDTLLATTSIDVWKAYYRFQALDAYARALPKGYVDAAFDFHQKTLSGVSAQQPRWRRCVSATDNALGEALGAVYVAQQFPPAAKARAKALVDNLQSVLHDDISTLDWMSSATKARAETKLAAFTKKIGYPDHFRDYSKLVIGDGVYATDVLLASRFEHARDMAKIGKPTDRSEWGMTPPTVNAYYSPNNNEIVFPAGILRPPYFSVSYDDALNYGAIGATIGHEMTHGFDDQGRQFDPKGNLSDWWTAADAKRFNAKAKCIVDQFNGYDAAPGVKENGELLQGEAIADLGGITIAYRAFQRTAEYKSGRKIGGFTPDQRFFIAYANSWATQRRDAFARQLAKTDPHPDEKWRVNGTLANMPAFAAAFSCPAKSKMVRTPRCAVW